VFIWLQVSAAPNRDLFDGLGDADKAAVVDVLQGAGISYKIARDTGAIPGSRRRISRSQDAARGPRLAQERARCEQPDQRSLR
jgi:flagellar biosynthesis/type III secretory pathway M-ring protein FliF/YscJ